jgi:protein tyrosine phosphatase (PTP) superfamily phosphohydrolase (DUF442 family)
VAIGHIRNFLVIDERLATAGQPSDEQLAEVAAHGFEVVVNLGLLGQDYSLADEAGLVTSLGLAYHHVPVDFSAPRIEDVRRFLAVMDGCAGKKAFVHCAANYRATSFVALFGQARLGWTAGEADACAQQFWEPNDTWLELVRRARLELGLNPTAPAG